MNKKMKGLWSNEITLLDAIVIKLQAIELDVAANQGRLPSSIFKSIQTTLNRIRKNVENHSRHSFFDHRLEILKTSLAWCENKIDELTTHEKTARKTAHAMIQTIAKVEHRTARFYAGRTLADLFNKNTFSVFEHNRTAERSTWQAVSKQLNCFHKIMSPQHTKHNVLSLLLTPKDSAFIESVETGEMPIGGEIGLLAIQRLKNIHTNPSSTHHMRKIASETMRQKMDPTWPESLIHCDQLALEDEITKLALHALLHPDKKLIWLGTARAVEAAIDASPGEATYINPANKAYSWTLNRLWLQAATQLGYQFKLIEQHFPEVEAAILSREPSNLITQLAKEIRSDDPSHVSQYNGRDSPTATPQEILVLMEMGCIAHRDSKDASLSLFAPAHTEEPVNFQAREKHVGLKRHHSCPDFFKIAPLPPLSHRRAHFEDPSKSSVPLRIYTSGMTSSNDDKQAPMRPSCSSHS